MNSVCMPRCRTIYPVLARLCALFVALWLQASPVIRWMAGELHSGNLAAIVVRIGGVSAALLGGVQAVSGVSTSFNGPFSVSGQVGVLLNYRLDVTVIGGDHMMSFTADNLPPGILIVKQGEDTAFLRGTPTQAGTWDSTVSGWEKLDATGASASDTVAFTITGGSSPPSISVHPQGQRRLPGTNATFAVTASGTGTLGYHWRKDSNLLGLASNATLTLTNLTTNSAGAYSVIVSNSAGSVTSSPALLTIAARAVLAPSRGGASVRLAFTGETGVTYRVETATNVATTTWNTLTNLTPIVDGLIAVTNTPASSNLFYRLRLLGP